MSEHDDYQHEQPLPENVILHPERSGMDLPVVDILRTSHKADLEDCIVIGCRKNGKEFFAMTSVDLAVNMFMLQRAIAHVNYAADIVQQGIDDDSPPQPTETEKDKKK